VDTQHRSIERRTERRCDTAPASPGPSVQATRSTSASVRPACATTCRTSGTTRRMWSREASSGTTPPYAWCMSIWLCRASARRRGTPAPVDSTSATPVSSHDDSMPSTSMAPV
jgi:hypothetical protein